MSVQARIPAGLAAVHNFILDHDETDIHHYIHDLNQRVCEPSTAASASGELGQGPIPREEKERAETLRDQIASDMWESYQQYIHNDDDEEDLVG
jgi:hypothetical protein